jgi:hypothetical protein
MKISIFSNPKILPYFISYFLLNFGPLVFILLSF